MITELVNELINYGIDTGLVNSEDEIYVRNSILSILETNEYDESIDKKEGHRELHEILEDILVYAVNNKLVDDNIVARDLFDTKIMGAMVMPPSIINAKFWDKYKESSVEATNFYYDFSRNTNYIREDRIKKDKKWTVNTKYGELVITINLSKPEKDPKAIANALKVKSSNYPKCLLCPENEGFAGTMKYPARNNHRIISIKIDGEDWAWQYSPYVYYNEHCIVFNKKHIPMVIDESAFRKLFDFVEQFPHYFVGSNADLPIVGGSILAHEHFQGGNYTFPMEKAGVKKELCIKGFEDVKAGIVDWPMSVIRLNGTDKDRVVSLGGVIIDKWRNYSDESEFVFANTNGEPHNTITPIARMNKGNYELDLVLRNNITTEEYPDGVYHPHKEYHHIKKENIGLIEVLGLAILPARLNKEMELLADYLVKNKDVASNEEILKHADWANMIRDKYHDINAENIDDILKKEIGLVFKKVLENCGVLSEKGILRFIDCL